MMTVLRGLQFRHDALKLEVDSETYRRLFDSIKS